MEISFEAERPWLIGLLLAALLLSLGVLGHIVSPVEAGRPVLLSWERWQAMALERQVRDETGRLAEDVSSLQALLMPVTGADDAIIPHKLRTEYVCQELGDRAWQAELPGAAGTSNMQA